MTNWAAGREGRKPISKEQYVAIDLFILTLIMCVLEWAIRAALNVYPNEIYTISIVLPIALIAIMRHGAWGVLVAIAGGLVCCIISGARADLYLIYAVGNSFIASTLLWFKRPGKESIRKNIGLIVVYVITGYLSMNLGKSILAFILGYQPFFAILVRFLTTDALVAVMSVIILLVARRQDGVFEDQMQYLKRLAAEEENRNGSQA